MLRSWNGHGLCRRAGPRGHDPSTSKRQSATHPTTTAPLVDHPSARAGWILALGFGGQLTVVLPKSRAVIVYLTDVQPDSEVDALEPLDNVFVSPSCEDVPFRTVRGRARWMSQPLEPRRGTELRRCPQINRPYKRSVANWRIFTSRQAFPPAPLPDSLASLNRKRRQDRRCEEAGAQLGICRKKCCGCAARPLTDCGRRHVGPSDVD